MISSRRCAEIQAAPDFEMIQTSAFANPDNGDYSQLKNVYKVVVVASDDAPGAVGTGL